MCFNTSVIGHIWVILRQTYVTPIVTVLCSSNPIIKIYGYLRNTRCLGHYDVLFKKKMEKKTSFE